MHQHELSLLTWKEPQEFSFIFMKDLKEVNIQKHNF